METIAREDAPITIDDALDAIAALEATWVAKWGRVTLVDLGFSTGLVVRARGWAALAPELWRGYPGARSVSS